MPAILQIGYICRNIQEFLMPQCFSILLLSISIIQWVSILLVIILLFLAFKLLETNWSYKISKPWLWEDAVKNGRISKELVQVERTYRDKGRFYMLWFQVEQLKADQIPGAFAELGVYKGDTAHMLIEMAPGRPIYLFDTFEGFAPADLSQEPHTDERYTSSNFADTSYASVQKRFSAYVQVHIVPGFFPDSAQTVPEQQYALVHLDADLFEPTRAGLDYFYPKLSPGGILLVHDYNHSWEGVRKAVDEFAATIPEQFTPIADWQGSVVLRKNKA